MKTGSTKVVRCAIYTRVSTDQGLEQDFNSLDAQYEASQAYHRMTTPAEAAKHAAELGINHILDQQIRIARQKELIVKLERPMMTRINQSRAWPARGCT
jgi:hypothetical protein